MQKNRNHCDILIFIKNYGVPNHNPQFYKGNLPSSFKIVMLILHKVIFQILTVPFIILSFLFCFVPLMLQGKELALSIYVFFFWGGAGIEGWPFLNFYL